MQNRPKNYSTPEYFKNHDDEHDRTAIRAKNKKKKPKARKACKEVCTCTKCIVCTICEKEGIVKNTVSERGLSMHKAKAHALAVVAAAGAGAAAEAAGADEGEDEMYSTASESDLGKESEGDAEEGEEEPEHSEVCCLSCGDKIADDAHLTCEQCDHSFHLTCLPRYVSQRDASDMVQWWCDEENCKLQEEAFDQRTKAHAFAADAAAQAVRELLQLEKEEKLDKEPVTSNRRTTRVRTKKVIQDAS